MAKKLEIDFDELKDILIDLIHADKITIQSSINPHIISLGHFKKEVELSIVTGLEKPKKEEIKLYGSQKIRFTSNPICIYPSSQYLIENRDVSDLLLSPYKKELALAEPQLKPVFFEIDVLERYVRDPRYRFEYEDYSGQISYNLDSNNVPLVKKSDEIFLKTFGLGFDDENNRVAVAYLRYLNDLTPEHQQYWKSKEIDRSKCQMVKEYYENTIAGNWTNSYSIFSAFVSEQKAVNDLSKVCFGEYLFRETFELQKKPKEFTFFMMPTLENYHNFISLLDKMISENINKKFFEGKIELFEYEQIDESTRERKPKATLRLLEEWLISKYKFENQEDAARILFQPFKKVRRERQHPAHKINSNAYDKIYIDNQRRIMSECYDAMKNLRHIFQDHRESKIVEIPEWLDDGQIKAF